MIAFFNLWFDYDEYGLISNFLEKASVKLRGYAVNFLTTGFETLNTEDNKRKDKEAICSRLLVYWVSRIDAMKVNDAENFDEAIEFAGWGKNSPFNKRVTIELLNKTLEITESKIGDYRYGRNIVSGINSNGVGHELLAMHCLNKIANEPKIEHWYSYKKPLIEFMRTIIALPVEHENFTEIKDEAIKLANTFGRMNIYDLKFVYDELKDRI